MQSQLRDDYAECAVEEILASYSVLSQLPSLDPSPRVESLFEKLVILCCSTLDKSTTEKILTHPRIIEITTPLRRICADGEYQLEAHWTEKILKKESQAKANAALLTFTYYENYIDLVRMELNAIASVTKGVRPRTYAILGSGPLPMTSICILQALRNNSEAVTVHNFDRDPWVISKSSELGRKLGYTPKEVEFHCTDIQDRGLDLREFDVVYLASLVGVTNQEKQDAISSTVKQMSQKALLVLRSAHLLRSLLYPVIDVTSTLTDLGAKPLLIVHPCNQVVNSVVICQIDSSFTHDPKGTRYEDHHGTMPGFEEGTTLKDS